MNAKPYALLSPIVATALLLASTTQLTTAHSQLTASVTSTSTVYLAQAATLQVAPSLLTGSQPFVMILCRFADSTSVTPHPKSWFEGLLGNTYPGMDHYWREASYGKLNLIGSKVVGWYNLPQARSYYDPGRALEDCTAAADGDVFFPNFAGIILEFNDVISYGSGGHLFLNRDGQKKAYGVVWSGTEGQVWQFGLVHEIGHTFGLPHTTGIDPMAGGCGVFHPEYGELACHLIAFHKDLLGWFPADRKYVFTPGTRKTITLERLALPQTNNYLMAQIPIRGLAGEFYTIEARRIAGYDTGYIHDTVMIHRVDLSVMLNEGLIGYPAQRMDIPNTWPGWEVGETFTDTPNQITITVNSETTTGLVVTVEYLPTFTNKVYLPLISGGSQTALSPIVHVQSAWTTDGNDNSKSTFTLGDNIKYRGVVINPTVPAVVANLRWSVTGPCGSIFSWSYDYDLWGGGKTPADVLSSIPTNACGGTYIYTLTLTYNGLTSSKSIAFTVTGQ